MGRLWFGILPGKHDYKGKKHPFLLQIYFQHFGYIKRTTCFEYEHNTTYLGRYPPIYRDYTTTDLSWLHKDLTWDPVPVQKREIPSLSRILCSRLLLLKHGNQRWLIPHFLTVLTRSLRLLSYLTLHLSKELTRQDNSCCFIWNRKGRTSWLHTSRPVSRETQLVNTKVSRTISRLEG